MLAWIRFQWNQPDRTDQYIMQLTAVIRSYMENKRVTSEQCKMPHTFTYQTDNPFKEVNELPQGPSESELRTMAALGVNW